jgi:type VI secretion system FHA domain protein
MTLTLSVLRCPDGVPPETRRLTSGELSIGRDPRNDWVLPDPDRILSKRHCVVSFHDNAWQVTDASANGTFLNSDVERLAPEEPRLLRNGDRLRLGAYEIEAMIDSAAGDRPLDLSRPGPSPGPLWQDDRLTSDPFPSQENDPLGIAMPPVSLAAAFPRTMRDNVPAVGENFRPPRPSLELLPDDWDADLAEPSAPGPAARPPRVDTPGPARLDPPAPSPLQPVTAQPPPFRPVAPSLSEPIAAPPTPPAAAPMQRAVPETPPQTAPGAADAAAGTQAFAAFAAGAGIDAPAAADPMAALHALGRAFRAVVRGLRRTMIARAAVKGEFRIEQTMIRERGNNPLKFSADDDDALTVLIGTGRRSEMTAERAVDEAMRDIRLHELAVATAMQQAVRDLLGRLDPAQIERRAGGGGLDFLFNRGAVRRWRVYEALHRETAHGLTDDFDRVFGTAFMRAYERAMSELAEQQGE